MSAASGDRERHRDGAVPEHRPEASQAPKSGLRASVAPATGLALSLARPGRSRPAAGPGRPPPPSAGSCARSRTARASVSSSRRRTRSRSQPRATTTWAASAPKPAVTVQTWRSWTERTPSSSQIAAPIASTSRSAGRRLHQHVEGLLDQAPGGGEDEGGDQQADDRVDDVGAAEQDEGAGEDDAERAERVGDAVAQDALEVDVLALAAGQDQVAARLPARPKTPRREDAGALDRGRVGEPADRRDRRCRR